MTGSLEAVLEAARKIRARTSAGSSTEDGKLYHDLPWKGLDRIPAHRRATTARLVQIASRIPIRDKAILDVGCGSGAMAIGLALRGALVTGVDRDPQALEVARRAAAHVGVAHRTIFRQEEVDPDWARVEGAGYDVVLWLSGLMWVRKEQGLEAALEVLWQLSVASDYLVVESAAADGEAGLPGATQTTVREWIGAGAAMETLSSAPSPAGWYDRRVFFLEHPTVIWEGDTARVYRISRTAVRKNFRPGFAWMAPREAECLRRLEACPHVPNLLGHYGRELEIEFGGWSRDVSSRIIERDSLELITALELAGVRHRDLRPSNLLAIDGRLQAIDFGWALLDGETRPPVQDRPELNDREDGRGKWGGASLRDDRALEAIRGWMKSRGR